MPPLKWNVTEVTPEKDLSLKVRFVDGTTGKVRFLPTHLTGVFEPLKNKDMFKKAYIEAGAVTWPCQADLAPDAMYEEIKKTGEWILK